MQYYPSFLTQSFGPMQKSELKLVHVSVISIISLNVSGVVALGLLPGVFIAVFPVPVDSGVSRVPVGSGVSWVAFFPSSSHFGSIMGCFLSCLFGLKRLWKKWAST